MDVLAHLLDGARAHGGALHQSVHTPPWSLRIADGAPVSLATLLRGEAWICVPGASPVLLRPRDVAIIRGPEPYTVGDDPATEPQFVITAGNRCLTLDGVDISDEIWLGVRTCGDSADGPTMVLSGTYQMRGDVSDRLLSALPPILVVPDVTGPVMDLVVAEVNRDEPGQDAVLDRLLDLLFVSTLRQWFARPDARPPAWYAAQSDPVVGRALQLLHDNPAHPWTVALLAAKIGVSRAALARRFTSLVGEPPMTYLTGWRISLAADLLREADATVAAVARQVGYANAFALSVAFKRLRGISPSQHRARSCMPAAVGAEGAAERAAEPQ